jgi:hypothetical protein
MCLTDLTCKNYNLTWNINLSYCFLSSNNPHKHRTTNPLSSGDGYSSLFPDLTWLNHHSQRLVIAKTRAGIPTPPIVVCVLCSTRQARRCIDNTESFWQRNRNEPQNVWESMGNLLDNRRRCAQKMSWRHLSSVGVAHRRKYRVPHFSTRFAPIYGVLQIFHTKISRTLSLMHDDGVI